MMARPRQNATDVAPTSVADAPTGEEPKQLDASEGAVTASAQTQPIQSQAAAGNTNQANPQADVEEALDAVYVVARGRSVVIDKTLYRPGMSVSLDEANAKQLLAIGFVTAAVDDTSSRAGVSVGTLKIIGGRKPGGVVAR